MSLSPTVLDPDRDLAVLDNLTWHALTGPHAGFAEVHGGARRYRADFAPYGALPDERDDQVWRDLATLVGSGTEVALSGASIEPPVGWTTARVGHAVQLVAEDVRGGPDAEAAALTAADVPEIFDLIERTRPGPWRPRTIELGHYLGIRRQGRLVAMAGERVHPTGWTEVSAVCTEPEHRGRGLATRLVNAVVHGIRDRGDEALLHASVSNTTAIRLYEQVGFRARREVSFVRLVAPGL